MLIRRRRLGTVYTAFPAKNIRKWSIETFAKLCFGVIMSCLWLLLLYVMVGVVNFIGGNVGELWEAGIPTIELYNHVNCFPLKPIGIMLVFLYVFRKQK